ncbi:alpha/beta fold hydrolase [Flavobacterium silvaticum]|uniref:Alpha/beta fold hydrolase n=1 Tax=Flavobacterium silvaticum TaxID=1852020 RepID=A0A972FTP4_9FLAO|nr:alpha/beta fold hydrolase [Flavobacterium silvaticum]NMH27395.1 alpha/beta fold hydrolase [Flavobacterium silvaticum]
MKKTISSLLTAVFAFTAFGFNSTDESTNSKPQTYVLVHGAWQSPYVWDTVRTNLEKKGNHVIVVELPAHGTDATPVHILSINAYRDKVIEAISNVDGKVILVGHSMAGAVVTAVAESIPSRITKLVYIGAFLPASGQSIGDLAMSDPDSKLGPSLVESADRLTLDVKADQLTNLFIADGNASVKQKIIDNYRAEPAIPFGDKIIVTEKNFGSVQKAYIKTLQDVVISPRLQSQMIANARITTVFEVNTSHSPFLSQPETVSDLLLQIGK